MPTNYASACPRNTGDGDQVLGEAKLLSKMEAIFEGVRVRAQMLAVALPISLVGEAYAQEPIVLIGAGNGTSADAQGGVVGTPLNETRLNSKISDTQNKIAEIEAKGDLSGKDHKDVYLLKKQLITLENQKQAAENGTQAKQAEVINAENQRQVEQKEAIKDKTETVKSLEEITAIIGG